MLLDYVTHINVADGNDLLDKIRQFAVSKGWTEETWEPQMKWAKLSSSPDVYGFLADTDSAYLCLSTTGYGTTPIIAKFYLGLGTWGSSSSLPSSGGYYIWMAMAASVGPDYTNSGVPYGHDCLSTPYIHRASPSRWTSAIGLSVSNTETINQVWIFGDDKWICAVVNYDGYNCHQIHFGQFEMFEANPYQGMICGYTVQYSSSYVPNTYLNHYAAGASSGCAWFRKGGGAYAGGAPLSCGDLCYSDDDSLPVNTVVWSSTDDDLLRTNIQLSAIGSSREKAYDSQVGKAGFNLEKAIQLNAYGSARMMMKIIYFAQSRIDDTYIPICKSSVYLTRFDNLSIGEILNYGTEQYMFFPLAHITDTWGIAFRIA